MASINTVPSRNALGEEPGDRAMNYRFLMTFQKSLDKMSLSTQ
jgi:hypothetical protein